MKDLGVDSFSGKVVKFLPGHAFEKDYEAIKGRQAYITFDQDGSYKGKWEAGMSLDDVPEVSVDGKYKYKKISQFVAELYWDGGGDKFISTLVFDSDKSGYFVSYKLVDHPVRLEHCGRFEIE